MQKDQKDEPVITNNQRDQQNQGSQPNHDNHKTGADALPNPTDKDNKAKPEFPLEQPVKEKERIPKTPEAVLIPEVQDQDQTQNEKSDAYSRKNNNFQSDDQETESVEVDQDAKVKN